MVLQISHRGDYMSAQNFAPKIPKNGFHSSPKVVYLDENLWTRTTNFWQATSPPPSPATGLSWQYHYILFLQYKLRTAYHIYTGSSTQCGVIAIKILLLLLQLLLLLLLLLLLHPVHSFISYIHRQQHPAWCNSHQNITATAIITTITIICCCCCHSYYKVPVLLLLLVLHTVPKHIHTLAAAAPSVV